MKNNIYDLRLRTTIASSILLVLLMGSCSEQETQKLGYVDNMKLFTSFQMQEDLFKQLEVLTNKRKTALDSLKVKIEAKKRVLKEKQEVTQEEYEAFETLKQEYYSKESRYSEEIGKIEEKYNQQIWDKLNSLTRGYGEDNEYDFIYGANGSGSLMYSKEDFDVTDKLIEYCNAQYQK